MGSVAQNARELLQQKIDNKVAAVDRFAALQHQRIEAEERLAETAKQEAKGWSDLKAAGWSDSEIKTLGLTPPARINTRKPRKKATTPTSPPSGGEQSTT